MNINKIIDLMKNCSNCDDCHRGNLLKRAPNCFTCENWNNWKNKEVEKELKKKVNNEDEILEAELSIENIKTVKDFYEDQLKPFEL